MRAYLKLALIVTLAFVWDRTAFAPLRESAALCDEALYDWPRCLKEVADRTEQLRRSCGDVNEENCLSEYWTVAEQEHRRHCTRGHLADEMNARRLRELAKSPPARPVSQPICSLYEAHVSVRDLDAGFP